MPENVINLNVIPNLLRELADIIDKHVGAEITCRGGIEEGKPVSVSILANIARNTADSFEVGTTIDSSDLELDLANLIEGGTFSIELSFDRSKFYLEIADDWTGHIKRIFTTETFAGVIKAASDKKDEADLIYQMSKEQPVPKEEEPNEGIISATESMENELTEEASRELWAPGEVTEDTTVSSDGDVAPRAAGTLGGVLVNIQKNKTEEKISEEDEKARKIVQEEFQSEHTKYNQENQDAIRRSADSFPEKEATRNNFFGPSKKDELPGQKTFPVDPEAFTKN